MTEERKTGGFRNLGEFAVAARKYTDRVHADRRLDSFASKTMTEGVDSGGGFTVPEAYADEVRHAALEGSIVRSRAIVHPMTRDVMNVPVLVDSDRSSSIFGGITFTWVTETEDKAALAADPAIGQLKLTAHEGVATTFVSNQLEDDYEGGHADKFENFIKLAFGRAIRFYEDDYYIWGTGGGQPLGIMNGGSTISVTRTAMNDVRISDIGNMASRLFPGSWATAIWLINQSVLAQWIELTQAAANSASVLSLADMRLLGRPIIVTEKCSALGTTGDIILADFANGYVVGDRAMEIAGSRHVNYGSSQGFLRNETFWRIVLRVDGQPLLSSAVTPLRGGSTVSHFVTLATSS